MNDKMNDKQKNGTKITLWIFGAVVFPLILILGNGVVATEKGSRERDTEIQREATQMERRLTKTLAEIKETQNTKFTEILIAIERLKK